MGRVDWEEVAAMVRRSYSLVAPKRLAGVASDGE
jgi:predicted DNA-binding protein (MmcQ/YjbR family)